MLFGKGKARFFENYFIQISTKRSTYSCTSAKIYSIMENDIHGTVDVGHGNDAL